MNTRKSNGETGYYDEVHPNQDIEEGFLTDNGEFESGIREENFMDVENAQAAQGVDDSDVVAHINSPVGEGLLDVPPPLHDFNQDSQDGPALNSQGGFGAAISSQNAFSNQATEDVVAPQDEASAERDLEKGMNAEFANDENSYMIPQDSQVEVINTQSNNAGAVP